MTEITLSSDYLTKADFENEKEIAVFNGLLNGYYEPDYKSKLFNKLFNIFIGEKEKPVFENTKHEKVFSIMFPKLEQQVTFGTGKGGYKEWGVKKFTADFYDKKENTIYEIDGESHFTEIGKLKDRYRDGLLCLLYGVKTVRITNEEVEIMLLERIRKVGVEKFVISK